MGFNTWFSRKWVTAVAVACPCFCIPIAFADNSSGDRNNTIDEIVVTAQKRDERLIDVPISIAVISGEQMRERQITSLDDLKLEVPGLSIQSNGGYSRTLEIRGVSNYFGNWPTVGMYLGEADADTFSNPILNLNAYDLERVEVLKGPQGTLYGQGSTGGTIRFLPNKPDLTKFGFDADVASTFTERGAPGQRINSMLNIPLIDDTLGVRVATTFERDGGWIDQPAANQRDINGQDLTDVRVSGLWQPFSAFTANALAEINRTRGGTNNGEDANGNYTQTFGLATTPHVDSDFDIYNLTLAYDLSLVRLLETTTYVYQTVDTSNLGLTLPIAPPPAAPLQDLLNVYGYNEFFTEEVRATSTDAGPWKGTVGGIYRDVRQAQPETEYFLGFSPPLPSPGGIVSSFTSSKSWAVFGDTSYKMFDRFTLGVGARYFRDDENNHSFDLLANSAVTLPPATFDSFDPRIYFQFEPTSDINVYASAAKGFRSGGFNGFGQPTYSPETVWTYEIGAKTTWLSHSLSLNAGIYYSDYTNYQVTSLVNLPTAGGFVNITSNGGDAWIKGVEAEMEWRPTTEWTLTLNGNWLDTKFYSVLPGSSYNVGDGLDFVPKYSFDASVKRDFSVSDKRGFVRLDYNQQGTSTYRNRQIGDFFFSESDVIYMLNFNASIYVNPNLRLGLFAQNLTNDRGYEDAYSVQSFAARPRPRSYGVDFGVSY
jgi:iron complex outermembrane recepter protein